MLDYITAFTFPFRDPKWLKKLLIASLLTYTVIGADPVMGWPLEIARRMGQGEPPRLPEWEDWRGFWRQGSKFLGVNIFWLLPLLLSIVLLYLPLLVMDRLPDATLLALWGGLALCVALFLIVYSGLYVFFIPAMLVRLTRTGGIWASASPLALWRTVRPHFSGYLIVFALVGIGLTNIILFLSALTLFLFLPPLLVYLGLFTSHFCGQLARRAGN